jgi:hypothetical protein
MLTTVEERKDGICWGWKGLMGAWGGYEVLFRCADFG